MSSINQNVFAYRLWRWDCAELANGRQIVMQVGTRQGRFRIRVDEANLRNSPEELQAFDMYYRAFLSRSPWIEGRTAAYNSEPTSVIPLSLNDCVEWVLPKLLRAFEPPQPRMEMTLEEFWTLPCYPVRVKADASGLQIRVEEGGPAALFTKAYWNSDTQNPMLSLYTNAGYPNPFLTTSWSLVTIPAEPAITAAGDAYPDVVYLGGQPYHFQPIRGSGREILTPIRYYAYINAAVTARRLRTDTDCFSLSRMHSFVVSDNGRMLGILSTHVPNLVTLREALQSPAATVEQKADWQDALRYAVRIMNTVSLRFFWNCFHLDCIMVDSLSGRLQIRQCTNRLLQNRQGQRRTGESEREDLGDAELTSLFENPLWN